MLISPRDQSMTLPLALYVMLTLLAGVTVGTARRIDPVENRNKKLKSISNETVLQEFAIFMQTFKRKNSTYTVHEIDFNQC